MFTRRGILKATAALPVAAVLPATTQATPEVLPTTNAIVPGITRTIHPWRWWVSYDQEVCYEGFDTREEAVEYAKHSEYPYVLECKQQDFSLELDADEILEMLYDHQYDLVGEGEFIESTKEERKDLSERLTKVMYEWATEHRISLTAWSFAASRNCENIEPEVSD